MGKKKTKDKKRSGPPLWLMLPLIIVLMVLLKASFILLIIGCMPTIVAYYADTTEEKMEVASVACCNFAGVLPYVAELSMAGNHWNLISYYMGNMRMWMMVYGMAALGYFLIKFCPFVSHYLLRAINSSKVFQLQQKQDALVKEWGEEIAKLPS